MLCNFILILSITFGTINCLSLTVPNLSLKALSPKGIRVILPDNEGIQHFTFHGNKNKIIENFETGDFNGKIQNSNGGQWVYYDPEIQLQVGDIIHYWIFVQYNDHIGLIKDHQIWNVTELIPFTQKICDKSQTILNGNIVCKGQVIFEDDFAINDIDDNKWFTEQYIPTYSYRRRDFEFVSYRNDIKNVDVQNEVLYLKPIPLESENDLKGTLDLNDDCSSDEDIECEYTQKTYLFLPPVKSGKVRTKATFRYGKIEIRTKLPSGDWIFPIVNLVSKTDENITIWLAYARGNEDLMGNNGIDIGSRLLLAGPSLSAKEPKRSEHLISHSSSTPFTSDVHLYTCIWKPGSMKFYFDNLEYGTINTTSLSKIESSEYYLTFGVGVGGVNNFPDMVTSNGKPKPWSDKGRKNIKAFFDNKDAWLPTWKGDQCAMQIDSVKITAI